MDDEGGWIFKIMYFRVGWGYLGDLKRVGWLLHEAVPVVKADPRSSRR